MKEIGCIFTMNGTYHLNEKSVYAARLKAMENLPLPENRDYVPDSLIVDDITECMVANGWDEDEVDALSRFTTETLTAEIDRRCKLGIEEDDEGEFTTTRLKEFLLDFYGVEYGASVENGPQSNNQSLSKCFIVICSNSVDEGGACAFDSLTGAWKDVKDDVKNAEKDLVSQGHHPTTIFKSEGATVYVPDSDIYYEWTIIQSTFSKSQKKSPDAPSPAPHHPAEEKVVTEMCPHCMREVTIHWDTATMGFKAFCPVCGNSLMLCDECRRSGAPCDYNGEKNCCRLNPSKPASTEVPSALRVETPLGAIIVRADMDEDGVWVDLRRPDADQDMSLVYVSCSPMTETTEPRISVRVDGEGRRNHTDKEIIMDGIEEYFRTEDSSIMKFRFTSKHRHLLSLRSRSGQDCEVLYQVSGSIFRVQFEDGFKADVFTNELTLEQLGVGSPAATFIFDSHGWDSTLNSRTGESVEILLQRTKREIDEEAASPMFHVRFGDGFASDVLADELILTAWRTKLV